MTVYEKFQSTLEPLSCPVSKPPGDTAAETYVTFNLAMGAPEAYASNQPHREYSMVQLHIFSRRDDGTHMAIFNQAVALLKAAGVRVRSWGPDDYEMDTKIHHIAATCEYRT